MLLGPLLNLSTAQMLFLTDCVGQTTPRGLEHNSTNNDSNVTYNSNPVKRWPESGTDPAKAPKISPELQQIIDHWDSLPEHIKAAIKALVQTHIKGDK